MSCKWGVLFIRSCGASPSADKEKMQVNMRLLNVVQNYVSPCLMQKLIVTAQRRQMAPIGTVLPLRRPR